MSGRRRTPARGPALTALAGLCLCLSLCAVSLLASGAVGPVHVALLLGAAGWQWWRWTGHGGSAGARRWWWEACSLAALFFFIADLFVISRDLVGAALRLLVFIVAYHADNPQPARRARQTLGLTLIQMIAASASTTEVVFSILMTVYMAAALWTLVSLGAAEREGARATLSPLAPAPGLRAPLARMTLATAPVILAAGLGVFFVIPHYGTGYFREQGKSLRRNLTGFSDRIELGSIGSIKKSHATVMRVDRAGGGDPPLPLRLRGVALDRFDGRVWERSDQAPGALLREDSGAYLVGRERLAALPGDAFWPDGTPRDLQRRDDVLSLRITVEPLESRIFFTPPDLISVTPLQFQSVSADLHGNLFAGGPRIRRFPYGTTSLIRTPAPGAIPVRALGDAERDLYLQLPGINPAVVALGRQVTAGITGDEEKARALESWLIRSFRYSLDVNDAAVADPLTHLLIERRAGHCEYFATALAVYLRLEGIPSRVVTGFHGGEHSDLTGQTIVRQSDAHSWVEAWLPDRGWIVLDATPPDPEAINPGLWARFMRLFDEAEIAWDTYIVGLDLNDQHSAMEEIRDWYDMAASGAFISVRRSLAALQRWIGLPGTALPGPASALGLLVLLAGVLITGVALILVWRRIRRARAALHPATRLFLLFEKKVGARGDPRQPWMTPGEFARARHAPEVAAAYEAARYGPTTLHPDALTRLRDLVRSA